jgi:methyl-accepting chemotaxis protein
MKKKALFSMRSFSSKATLIVLVAIGFAIVLSGVIAYREVAGEVDRRLEWQTLVDIRVASQVVTDAFPGLSIERDAAGEPVALRAKASLLQDVLLGQAAPEDVIDRITEVIRGTTTIFSWDEQKSDFVRIATSVRKADGTRAVGTVLGSGGPVYPVIMAGKPYRGVAPILGQLYQTGYIPVLGSENKPIGIIYIGVGKIADLSQAAETMLNHITLAGILVFCITGLATGVVCRRIIRPIPILAGVTTQIASESFQDEIPFANRMDEVGELSRALNILRDAVAERASLRARQSAEAEISAERHSGVEAEIKHFRAEIASILEQVRSGSQVVDDTSRDLTKVTDEALSHTMSTQSAADRASITAVQVASASSELSHTVNEISRRTGAAVQTVGEALMIGQRSKKLVSDLSGAAERIGAVVAAIESIASQTNLLALNATIEAARAGEAGRGFAVVASEVKALATQTATATAEIGGQISAIQSVTRDVVEAFGKIEEKLRAVDNMSTSIAEAVEEQDKTTASIAQNANEAADTARIMQENVTAIEKVVSRAQAATVELEAMARQSSVSADRLVQTVNGFLLKVVA